MKHRARRTFGGLETAFGHLAVERLSVRVAGETLLTDVSLEVTAGEAVGLLGRDGAGKTICLDAIAGQIRAAGGRVSLNGVDVSRWASDQRACFGLGYLPEAVSIFRGLTAEENVLAALEASEPDPLQRVERLSALLTEFDLTTVRHQTATSLSGGERRRCEVARAMALNPSILLLDEPFRGLDPTSVASTKRVIRTLKDRGVGVLLSDYDVRDLLELTERVYVLHDGRMIFSGNSEELLSDSAMRKVFLGDNFSL